MVLFLFTPPRRGRHGGYLVKFGNYTNFYSRPREGGDQHCEPLSPYVLNFYSRPREGGDASIDGQDISAYISIHAPAKGATIDKVCINYREYISIHAPAKGATFLLGYHHCILTYFYSRPREGGDSTLL